MKTPPAFAAAYLVYTAAMTESPDDIGPLAPYAGEHLIELPRRSTHESRLEIELEGHG